MPEILTNQNRCIRLDEAPDIEGVWRADRGEVGEIKVKRTDEGFLRTEGFVRRAGILEYRYRKDDGTIGTRRELVSRQVLEEQASLDSLRMIPVTNGHPDPGVYPDMVTSDNYADLSVGTTGEAVRVTEDARVACSIVVQDQDALEDVDNGKRFLSLGYRMDLVVESGVDPEFGEYDARQINWRGNHVALTRNPRAGDSAFLRLDSSAIEVEDVRDDRQDTENGMDLIEKMTEQLGCDRETAERLLAEGQDALTRIDSLPTDEQLAEEAAAAKIAAADARVERVRLDQIATEVGIEIDETVVRLDNDELRAKILEAASVEVIKRDDIDATAMFEATWQVFEKTRKTAPIQNTQNMDEDEDEDDDETFVGTPRLDEGLSVFSLNRYAPNRR